MKRFITLLLLSLWLPLALAANDPIDPAALAQRKLDALDANDSSVQTRQLRELYSQVIQQVQERQQYQAQIEEYDRLLKGFSQTNGRLQKELNQYRTAELPDYRSLKLEQLEQELSLHNAELYELQNQLSALRTEINLIGSRSLSLREELSLRKAELDATLDSLSQENRKGSNGPVAEALQWQLSTRRDALSSQVRMLELEQLSAPNRSTLADLRRQLLERQTADLEKRIASLQEHISTLRRAETEKTIEANRKLTDAATDSPPLLKDALSYNQRLSDELNLLTSQIDDSQKQRVLLEEQSQRLQQRFNDLKKQLEWLKVSLAFGETLRAELRDLPRALPVSQVSRELAQVQLQHYDYEQQLSKLSDRALVLADYVSRPEFGELTEQDRQTLKELLELRYQLLQRLQAGTERYVRELAQLDLTNTQLVQRLEQFEGLIKEHLLWVPSARPLYSLWLLETSESLQWLLAPYPWQRIGHALLEQPANLGLGVLGLTLLFALYRPGRRQPQQLYERIQRKLGKVTQDNFLLSLEVLLTALFASLPLPTAGFLLAWLLAQTELDLALALGEGLVIVSLFGWVWLSLRQLAAPNGLFLAHFNWPQAQVERVIRSLRGIVLPSLLAVLLIAFTEAQNNEALRNTLGRAAFMLVCVLLAGAYWRLLATPALWLEQDSHNSLRLRLFQGLRLVAAGGQLLLLLLAARGYYFSALTLQWLLQLSLLSLLIFLSLHALARRWLLLEERRLAFARAKAKRAEILAQRAKDKESANLPSSNEAALEPTDENLIDLQTISEQSRKVLRLFSGLGLLLTLWGLWGDLFTSLNFLDQITLWETSVSIQGVDQIQPVTLKALLFSLLTLLLTVVAVRNLPGLLEILVLQRIQLSPGSGYALTTMLKYCLIVVGVLVAFAIIGFDWSKLQWLVAALGVGLGFGLQEIFANFISGLILLFEKPIRIGDTVTINGLTGTVTKIKTRATTIVDWDRMEIIVPNKTFITQQLVNWTLSDSTTRVVITIGVAYGSDTALAERLILQAAKECQLVLATPEPEVFFLQFADSTLQFELRVFVADMGHRNPARHQIHNRINQLFRDQGVEIAFPQLDVHIKQECEHRVKRKPADNSQLLPPPKLKPNAE